jgi:hypothetical protein
MRCWAGAVSMVWSGIGSGAGAAALSHSSVQALRSILAGLPVSDRERTVSLEVAASILRCTAGSVSASSVVSQTEPHHTPWAPSAIAAATWAPVTIPPAARTGVGETALTTSGTRTMVEMVPVWPPASVPWATMRSTPAACWRRACSAVPTSAATMTPRSLAWRTTSGGGGPSALANSRMGWPNATSSRVPAARGETLREVVWACRCSGSSGTP